MEDLQLNKVNLRILRISSSLKEILRLVSLRAKKASVGIIKMADTQEHLSSVTSNFGGLDQVGPGTNRGR